MAAVPASVAAAEGWTGEMVRLHVGIRRMTPLKPKALAFLNRLLNGPGAVLPDASLASVMARVPESRLPSHPLVSPGAETRIPMAIAINGGVTLSTLLTLFVVPCFYSLFVRLERPEKEDRV